MYDIRYEDETFAVWLEPNNTPISLWTEKEPVFVCGKLMEPSFISGIIGRAPAMAPAVAINCRRAWQDHKARPYIFLMKSVGGFVSGMALLGITDKERAKLEEFEEIGSARIIESVMLRIGERDIAGISFFKR